MNIKSSASRKAALAAVAVGLAGFGLSATAMADTTSQAATGCQRITFTVLHNDTTGGVELPQGPYVVWSSGMSCQSASEDFTNFLNRHQGAIPGWTGHQAAPGYASYTNNVSGQSFSVGHMADR